MGSLWVEFAGETQEVSDRLSFGRDADLDIDDANRFMHRVTGEFTLRDSAWWLLNRGSSTRLIIFGTNGARVELPPETMLALPLPTGSVSFVAGPTPYQLTYQTDVAAMTGVVPVVDGTETMEFGTQLTERESIYLTTFALPRLRGTSAGLLTYAEVAALWGVSEKTIDNTLQRVRGRLKSSGVRDTETLDGLINHLLAHGRIGLQTLATTEQAHPTRLGALPD